MIEEWKVVEQAPRYAVSNEGVVKNHYSNIVLKQSPDENGEMVVYLQGRQGAAMVWVGKLVAQYFMPPAPGNMVIGHKDFNRKNNRVANLRWVAPHKNGFQRLRDDADRPPLIPGQKGRPRIPVRVVETGEVYESMTAAAKAVGGFVHNISMCLSGKQKHHRGYTFEYADWE